MPTHTLLDFIAIGLSVVSLACSGAAWVLIRMQSHRWQAMEDRTGYIAIQPYVIANPPTAMADHLASKGLS